MPYCPNCRTEYNISTTRCNDCGAQLVDNMPINPSTRAPLSANPFLLTELDDLVALDLLESQLRAAGIPTTRRPRRVALFVPESNADFAQQILEGKTPTKAETLGLSELNRIRLVCEECERATVVDILSEPLPQQCACGRHFDLSEAQRVLDRYTEVMRMMADADFEIELEAPE